MTTVGGHAAMAPYQKLLISCVLAALFIAQIAMVMKFEINWDEFFMLDWLYQFRRGELLQPLQTIYLHLLGWVPHVGENEVTQIVAVRIAMLGCTVGTCLFIFGIVRRFFSSFAALVAVISFMTFSFVFRHGMSFRADAIVVCTLMAALFFATDPRQSAMKILTTGFLIGLAGMITIKAIFYAPIFAVILLARWADNQWSRRAFLQSISLPIIAVCSFFLLYALNAALLGDSGAGVNYVAENAGPSVLTGRFFPEWQTFTRAASLNPFYVLLFIVGASFLAKDLASGDARSKWMSFALISFSAPLTTLFFYTHTHPYFYTFMLAPASIFIASAIDRPYLKNEPLRENIVIGVLAFLLVSATIQGMKQTLDHQHKTVDVIHKLFPQPVDYIDRTSMISSHHKHGIFMSGWKMREYYKANQAVFPSILEKSSPKFVLANIDTLDLDRPDKQRSGKVLLSEDFQVLRDNYIHHWGAIYVPGKILNVDQPLSTFEIIIAGSYTLESDHAVTINGNSYASGDTITLPRSTHEISSTKAQTAVLRWGKDLYKPAEAAAEQDLFRGF